MKIADFIGLFLACILVGMIVMKVAAMFFIATLGGLMIGGAFLLYKFLKSRG